MRLFWISVASSDKKFKCAYVNDSKTYDEAMRFVKDRHTESDVMIWDLGDISLDVISVLNQPLSQEEVLSKFGATPVLSSEGNVSILQ